MKVLLITLSLLTALNALACDGSGKSKDKEEDKDKRMTTVTSKIH
jgi:hypothetical protein